MKKKIAIIAGINGQDGYFLASLLKKKNYTTVGLSRGSENKHKLNKVKIIKTNYTFHHIKKIIKTVKPDIIFNLAGESNPEASWKKINIFNKSIVQINSNFLNAIVENSKKIKYFYASSSEIFGLQKRKISEKSPFIPNNPYGCFKLSSHLLVRLYREKKKLFAVNGILFNHDSKLRSNKYLLPEIINFCKKYQKGQTLKLIDGGVIRDFGHAEDVVKAIYQVMTINNPDDYIISCGNVFSVKQIAKEIFRKFNINFKNIQFLKMSKNNIRIGNTTKLRKKIKLDLKYKKENFLKEIINEY